MWRLIDASGNRAAEGLRVCEEILRFTGFEDGYIRAKRLRHRLRALLAPHRDALLAARDTAGDPGRTKGVSGEYRRSGEAAVFAANVRRAQEALRALEEAMKTHDARAARKLEALRFAAYALEKEFAGRVGRLAALREASLYVVCSRPREEALRVAGAVAGVAGAFQLRMKGADGATVHRTAEAVKRILAGSGTLFIVNDRADVAAGVGADGVHLGRRDLPTSAVRKFFSGVVGATVHTPAQLRRRLRTADYFGVGAFYPTRTRSHARARGPALAEIMKGCDRIWFAIGGVTEERLDELAAVGVERVAVGEAICAAADPGTAARRIKRRLERLLAERKDAIEGRIVEL